MYVCVYVSVFMYLNMQNIYNCKHVISKESYVRLHPLNFPSSTTFFISALELVNKYLKIHI